MIPRQFLRLLPNFPNQLERGHAKPRLDEAMSNCLPDTAMRTCITTTKHLQPRGDTATANKLTAPSLAGEPLGVIADLVGTDACYSEVLAFRMRKIEPGSS
jgi:hypothetical protein